MMIDEQTTKRIKLSKQRKTTVGTRIKNRQNTVESLTKRGLVPNIIKCRTNRTFTDDRLIFGNYGRGWDGVGRGSD